MMSIPTQIEKQIANDLALLVIDRISQYARRRSFALKRAAAAEQAEVERLLAEADKFEDLSKTFAALTDPDAIP